MTRAGVHPGAVRRGIAAVCLIMLALSAPGAAQAPHGIIDIGRQPIMRLSPGMTSRSISVFGARLGMSWEEARAIFERDGVPYLFSREVPTTVYIPPLKNTFYLVLHPATSRIIEMGVANDCALPSGSGFLARGSYWRLTSARTYFFGWEGKDVTTDEGYSFVYKNEGFVLRYVAPCCDFRFVMVEPERPRFTGGVIPVDIPFFVTGYWKPNTSRNLAELRRRLARGELKDARFINAGDERYDPLARDVDAKVDEVIHAIENVLARLQRSGDPYANVVIDVRGYADPRRITGGAYVDAPVSTDDMSIDRGAELDSTNGNMILSNLRAAFARDEFRAAIASQPAYRALSREGRIIWRVSGRGVAPDDGSLREQRRIVVEVRAE